MPFLINTLNYIILKGKIAHGRFSAVGPSVEKNSENEEYSLVG